MRPVRQLLSATALLLVASGAACKNDSGVTGPTSLEGQYKGTMAGESSPSVSASLDLTVADRKSTRLNSSHGYISYAVFCLKKKKKNNRILYSKMDHSMIVYNVKVKMS